MYEELYSENRGLLHTVVRRYAAACKHDRAVSVEDLEQAGFFGLVKASQTFDAEGGGSWPTWAARYIHKEMLKALGYRWRPSTGGDADGYRYRPTRAHTCALSLDAPLNPGEPDDLTGLDMLEDASLPATDEALNLDNMRQYVRRAVERLQNKQQRLVIRICGLEGKPYEAAAAALGVSAERVRQIRGRALERLRKDKALRDDARADIADIEARTPYYTHVTVTSFNRSHTSATEKAVLWRLEQEQEQEQRRAAQIERLKRIEQELTEKESLYQEKMGEIGKGGANMFAKIKACCAPADKVKGNFTGWAGTIDKNTGDVCLVEILYDRAHNDPHMKNAQYAKHCKIGGIWSKKRGFIGEVDGIAQLPFRYVSGQEIHGTRIFFYPENLAGSRRTAIKWALQFPSLSRGLIRAMGFDPAEIAMRAQASARSAKRPPQRPTTGQRARKDNET